MARDKGGHPSWRWPPPTHGASIRVWKEQAGGACQAYPHWEGQETRHHQEGQVTKKRFSPMLGHAGGSGLPHSPAPPHSLYSLSLGGCLTQPHRGWGWGGCGRAHVQCLKRTGYSGEKGTTRDHQSWGCAKTSSHPAGKTHVVPLATKLTIGKLFLNINL